MTLRAISTLLAMTALVIALTAALAPPAEAAKARKHKPPAASVEHPATTHARHWGANAVATGPLYNGPEYLGDDPDPNIRSYMLRDLSTRYGGGNN